LIYRVKTWVDKMQEDLVTLARTASGVDQLGAVFLKNRDSYTVEMNNAQQLVESAAWNIEKLLLNRSMALEVSTECCVSKCVPKQTFNVPTLYIMYVCLRLL
ncbi:CA2D1 protein, partial [Polyodon spathula]|nr:CA2D1 protein [Polyodon spathula]